MRTWSARLASLTAASLALSSILPGQEQSEKSPTLSDLQLELDIHRQRLGKPVSELDALYEKQLKEIEKAAREEGDLENLIKIQNELKSFSGSKPDTDPEPRAISDSPRLARFQRIYFSELAKRKLTEAEQLKPVLESHLNKISALQKRLTQANRVEDALEARDEVARADKLLADVSSAIESGKAKRVSQRNELDWKPGDPEEFKELLMAQKWNWFEKGNNQVVSFFENDQLRIDGKGGKFGWEITGARNVTLRLGAKQRQPMYFRLSYTEKELQPTEGASKSRKITLKPAEPGADNP